MKKTIIGITLGAIALGAPTVPTQLEWEKSCSDYKFDTPSGYLTQGYYYDDGSGYQIATSNIPCETRDYYKYSDDKGRLLIADLKEAVATSENIYADIFKDGGDKEVTTITKLQYENLSAEYSRIPTRQIRKSLSKTLISEVSASITRDATTTASGSGTSLTWSHTVSGSDTFLAVGGGTQGNIGITGVTYAGDSLVLGDGPRQTGNDRVYIHYDESPDSGSNNIVISTAGSASGIIGKGMSYNGVSGHDNSAGTVSCTSGTTCTVTFTVDADSWTSVMARNVFGALTPSTNLVGIYPSSSFNAFDSATPASGGSTAFSVTVSSQSGSFPTVMSAVSFSAVADEVQEIEVNEPIYY